MLRTFVTAVVLVGFTVATAAAQTATTPTTTTTQAGASTKPTTTQSTLQTSSSSQGAFDKLSPGNQKIAQALCDAQPGGCPTTSSPGQKTLTRAQIASMKQHRGWGEIFKDMKANGRIPSDVKNLGQLVSGRHQAKSGTSGTMITNGSGRTQVVGKPDVAGTSGKGHLDDDGAMDDRGANAGRRTDVSGHGRGYASGQGDSSVSGAGSGRSGFGGGGRGK